ncbi:MAG: 3-isopropylmalate dehydratase large subunit [Candidatus Tectomicrobia bacterium]
MPQTLLDKIWDQHVIAELGSGLDLLHIDRTLVHDLGGARVFGALQDQGHRVRNPELTFATVDHCCSSLPGRDEQSTESGSRLIPILRDRCVEQSIRLFDIDSPEQGIVHIIGPELGLTLPGVTLVCGDSHTCTHGGVGALSWGVGTSDLSHVLATQTLVERRPQTMRIRYEGELPDGIEPKDLILYVIGQYSAHAGTGYAVEYAGSVIQSMPIEGRLTICNLSIELGARMGLVAPDEITFDYLAGRPYAPQGAWWDRALAHWQTLNSDADAVFDREIEVEVSAIEPQLTWGISPEHVIGISDRVPDPAQAPDLSTRQSWERALAYMDLQPGQAIEGLPIDVVFIGSCTNSRLSDLQHAAEVVRGQKVAAHVEAWVVPGSQTVKREAEQLGLHEIFQAAGFEWREPGCSRCVATNGEYVPPGKRSVSTSNRNFIGRQGPDARTHLASPTMAARAAIEGCLTDVRRGRGQ